MTFGAPALAAAASRANEAFRDADPVAVLSAADFDGVPDCSPSAHVEPLLAVVTIHYVGQPVFLVVAASEEEELRGTTKASLVEEAANSIQANAAAMTRGILVEIIVQLLLKVQ